MVYFSNFRVVLIYQSVNKLITTSENHTDQIVINQKIKKIYL